MTNIFSKYRKKKDFLVCVDSDGCAMDTMDSKHIRCFGPCMVRQWGLEQWQEEILARWNEINLYTMTRGIHRFKGLSLALQEIDRKYCRIDDLSTLVNWVEGAKELSNAALRKAIDQTRHSVSLQKALAWSEDVNASIARLPDGEVKPFDYVKEALAYAHQNADVAVVSSANRDAVIHEWSKYDLLTYTDIVLAQDVGTKAFCIGEMLKFGYNPSHVLMCGDAAGDQEAAEKNGVYYYPILVRHEAESWREFREKGLDHLLAGGYGGGYQEARNKAFVKNLNGNRTVKQEE